MRVRRWLLLGALGLVSAAAVELSLEEAEAARERGASTMMHVNGSFVRYALANTQRERQLVVLLNGFNGALEQWSTAQPLLSSDFRVLIYDRGGLGFSTTHDRSVRAQADELLALLDSLGERRPVLIVGFSHSASLARLLAAEHPQRVGGLVLLDPYLPEIESKDLPIKHSGMRTYAMVIVPTMVKCLFGVSRVRELLAPVERDTTRRRVQTILRRFWHWKSDFDELVVFEETSRIVMSAPRIAQPVVLYERRIGADQNPRYRSAVDQSIREFIAKTPNARRAQLSVTEHGHLLDDAGTIQALREALLSVAH